MDWLRTVMEATKYLLCSSHVTSGRVFNLNTGAPSGRPGGSLFLGLTRVPAGQPDVVLAR